MIKKLMHKPATPSILLFALILLFTQSFQSCKDRCKFQVCENGGTCDDGTCLCPDGTTGLDCSILLRDEYLGTYDVTETCGQGNYTYVLTITADPDNIALVNIQNLGDFGLDFSASASFDGLTFNQTRQGLTLTGTGTINGNVLTIQFSTSGSFADDCSSSATKR